MTRQAINLEILKHLEAAVKSFPDLRFNQLLLVVGVVKRSNEFYEESQETLDRTLNTLELLYMNQLEDDKNSKE